MPMFIKALVPKRVCVRYTSTQRDTLLNNWFFVTPSVATKFQYINSL
jgi:hypothetical protein